MKCIDLPVILQNGDALQMGIKGLRKREGSGQRMEERTAARRRTDLRRHERAIRGMWEEGLNDCQIARRVGCSSVAIRSWRLRNRLHRNCRPGRPEEV